MLKDLAMLLLATSLISACGRDPARTAVAAAFEEPNSVKFQAVRDRSGYVCGEVNARRQGSYAGYRRFIYDKSTETPLVDPGMSGLAAESGASDAACTKPFAYQSVDERLSCARAPIASSDANRQRHFDTVWQNACT